MADIIDDANQTAANFLSDSENLIRSLVPPERPNLEEDVECLCCGEVVEPKRARLGFDVCYGCQSYLEKSNKQYNRSRSRSYDDGDY